MFYKKIITSVLIGSLQVFISTYKICFVCSFDPTRKCEIAWNIN